MGENYQVLARKYRPQTFADVVGQNATVTILKNAIRFKRSAQAYLFAGSRGVGKTTIARLLAKALNCQNLSEEIEPCNKCSSCLEIINGSSLDVIEIDGASNRGIDDIRQINETIGYVPTSGKYKIYIIDEVHMLTKEAFNALLKTLEEPPPSIKFFFATTEPHKIPPTILSRCQRFDLTRITQVEIINKLKVILQDLKREADEKALHLIASFADGSLRDSQSLLDQLLCYESGPLTEALVSKILGLIPEEYFFLLDEAIKKGSEAFSFELAEMIYSSGKDFVHFTEELLSHFRRYLVLKYQNTALELSAESLKKYQENAHLYTTEELSYLLEMLLTMLPLLQKSLSKKTTVEMLLLQIIRLKKRIALPQLIQRLMELEEKLSSNKTSPSSNLALHEEPPAPAVSPLSANPPPTEKRMENPPVKQSIPPSIASTSAVNPSATAPSMTAPPTMEPSLMEPSWIEPSRMEPPKASPSMTIPPVARSTTVNVPTANAAPVLTAVPFSLTPEKPLSQPSEGSQASPRLDTLLHFSAVEFNGIVKKE